MFFGIHQIITAHAAHFTQVYLTTLRQWRWITNLFFYQVPVWKVTTNAKEHVNNLLQVCSSLPPFVFVCYFLYLLSMFWALVFFTPIHSIWWLFLLLEIWQTSWQSSFKYRLFSLLNFPRAAILDSYEAVW